MAVDFWAGCLGGCAGVLVGHPFDTVKIRLQTQDSRNKIYRGTFHCISTTIKKESFQGLFKGMSSPMAGLAAVNAIVFGVYGNILRASSSPKSLQNQFWAGSAAGFVQSFVTSPMEYAKTRMQLQGQANPNACVHFGRKNTCSSYDGLSGIPTRTTPTLTPTMLKNIEESFMEVNPIPPAPLEHQHQAGFAPPIVSFTGFPKQEDTRWMEDCMNSSDRSLDSPQPPSETSTSSRPSKTGRGGGRRPLRDEKLSPEEEERRRVRRERNKLAAARCRKRRMELTSNLMNETDGLEEKRQILKNEITRLQIQKQDLEFLLDAHKMTCKLNSHHSKGKLNDGKPSPSRLKYSRPNSLSLSSNFNITDSPLKSSPSLSAININDLNSSLNTPSTGVFLFENMLDGNCPTTTTGSGMSCVISSCGGQQRSSSSDLSSPDSIAPPKLVSL